MSIDRECGKKVQYLTCADAFRAVMRMVAIDGWGNRYVYQCSHCAYYHFGRGGFAKLPARARSIKRPHARRSTAIMEGI